MSPGSVVEASLEAGGGHRYALDLAAHQYLRVVVGQGAGNVALTLGAPDGSLLKEVDESGRPSLDELLSVVTEEAGAHELIVDAVPAGSASGRYRLEVEEWRDAVPGDIDRVAAEDAFRVGLSLKDSPTEGLRREAVARLQQAAQTWRRIGDQSGEGRARHELGNVLFFLTETEDALDAYRRALALLDAASDPHSRVETLNALGRSLRQLGHLDEAGEHYGEALEILRGIDDPGLEALTHNNLGTLAFRSGRTEEALDHFQRALALYRQIGELEGVLNVLLNQGVIYRGLGRFREALECSESALRLAEQLEETDRQVNLLTNLGVLYRARGESDRALELLGKALELAQKTGNGAMEAKVASNLGDLYTRLGEPAQGERLHRRALGLNRQTGSLVDEARNLLEIGRFHHNSQQPDLALPYYTEALEKSQATGDRTLEGYVLHALGRTHAVLGRSRVAVDSLRLALEMQTSSANRPGQVGTLRDLGLAYQNLGDLESARQAFTDSLELAILVGDPYKEAATRSDLAHLERSGGRIAAAREQIEGALALAESLRNEVPGPELRASFFSRIQADFAFYIDLLMDLEAENPNGSYAEAAFEASERARARSLVELLTEAHIRVADGIAPDLAESQRETNGRLSWLQERLARALSRESIDGERVEALRRELSEVRLQRKALGREIRRQNRRYAEIRYPAPLTLDSAQRLVDRDSVLLKYVLGHERSWLFVVTRSDFLVRTLAPASEILHRVRRVEGALQKPSRLRFGRYLQDSRRLYELLVEPAAALLSQQRVLWIVPDPELVHLPFEVLIDPDEDTPEGGPSFLIDRWAVSYLPSATVLANLRQDAGKAAPQYSPTFLAFADPTLPAADAALEAPSPETLRGVLDRSSWRWLQLPGARLEVDTISRLFPPHEVDLYKGDRAQERNFKENPHLRTARYVHFASHAIVDTEDPAYTTILMTASEGEDGLLQVHEIFDLEMAADLVVLSACETGLGKEIRGEGLLGLTQAFFYAGAKSVLVSLWPVVDGSTAPLMAAFYRELAGGAGKAEALRRAKLEQIQSGRDHPYYWGPFVLTGDAY